jgi:hypothetical protein
VWPAGSFPALVGTAAAVVGDPEFCCGAALCEVDSGVVGVGACVLGDGGALGSVVTVAGGVEAGDGSGDGAALDDDALGA